jgi:hypothetical protein
MVVSIREFYINKETDGMMVVNILVYVRVEIQDNTNVLPNAQFSTTYPLSVPCKTIPVIHAANNQNVHQVRLVL